MRLCFTLALLWTMSSAIAQIPDTLSLENLKTIQYYYGESSYELIMECAPCIAEHYDGEKKLTLRAVQYTDCIIGWFERYDAKGNLKETGNYLPNNTDEGPCNIKDGVFYYLSGRGDTLYSEEWQQGEFIRQDPELKKCSLWGVKFFKSDSTQIKERISFAEFKGLRCVPQYKNSARPNSLKLRYTFSAGDRRGSGWGNIISHRGSLNEPDLSQIDLAQIIEEKKMAGKELYSLEIDFILDGRLVRTEYLKIE